LMLYCFPDLVKEQSQFPNDLTTPFGFELYPEDTSRKGTGLGALAPASNASYEVGKEIFQLVVEGLSEHIKSRIGG